MKLIVFNRTDGKAWKAVVRVTQQEISDIATSLAATDLDPDEVMDFELDDASEYQLLIGLEGHIKQWNNEATLPELKQIARKTRS